MEFYNISSMIVCASRHVMMSYWVNMTDKPYSYGDLELCVRLFLMNFSWTVVFHPARWFEICFFFSHLLHYLAIYKFFHIANSSLTMCSEYLATYLQLLQKVVFGYLIHLEWRNWFVCSYMINEHSSPYCHFKSTYLMSYTYSRV